MNTEEPTTQFKKQNINSFSVTVSELCLVQHGEKHNTGGQHFVEGPSHHPVHSRCRVSENTAFIVLPGHACG